MPTAPGTASDVDLQAMVFPAENAGGHEFAAIYEEFYELLVRIAIGRFRISESDAQALAHEVFVDYLTNADRIVDRRAWLVGAICNACRYHLRREERIASLSENAPEPLDPRSERVVDALPDQLAARQAFHCLTPRCQLALRLRYLEGYTVPEIATILGTTKKYAQKLIGRCLVQGQRRYTARSK